MTWLAWRQFRLPLALLYVALAAIAAVLLFAGRNDDELLYRGGQFALYLLPAAIGAFWGVPLITRELEAGTHKLVWNQGVTRGRWLAVKLGLGAVAAALAAGLLSAVVSWWAAPVDAMAGAPDSTVVARIDVAMFAARGITPVGYAVFAFVLGVAAGLVLRRTVAAMAVTLVVFAAVQVVVPLVVRPHLLPVTEQAVALSAENIEGVRVDEHDGPIALRVVRPAGAWVVSEETVDARGGVVGSLPELVRGCVPSAPRPGALPDFERSHACFAQLSELGYQQRLRYQPAARFWPLQWLETALFLVGSGLLGWFCFRRLRHVS
ncbi:ABC transporter permease subunit [Amycolatopsis albispora]|uniref:Transporter n=1 Tax=Amycolatopsis albispora TaxID=1804986 RepID=A0A344L3F0_9PSEU|nr:ABC transporter permease subunit [Amycolatopsis albispora]AXB42574.1 transporter [Amycolatopsis albispora]